MRRKHSTRKRPVSKAAAIITVQDDKSKAPEEARAKTKPLRRSEEKWGKKVMDRGFVIIPKLLLLAQRRLNLSPNHLALIVHLSDYWWEADRKPYPSKKTLADRLGIGARQVQRYLADLHKMGLIRRIQRQATNKGKMSNEYDFAGLVERLQELEPDFRKTEEEIKKKRRSLGMRQVRPSQKAETSAQ